MPPSKEVLSPPHEQIKIKDIEIKIIDILFDLITSLPSVFQILAYGWVIPSSIT